MYILINLDFICYLAEAPIRLAGFSIFVSASNKTNWTQSELCYKSGNKIPDVAKETSVKCFTVMYGKYVIIYNDRLGIKPYRFSQDAIVELCDVKVPVLAENGSEGENYWRIRLAQNLKCGITHQSSAVECSWIHLTMYFRYDSFVIEFQNMKKEILVKFFFSMTCFLLPDCFRLVNKSYFSFISVYVGVS